VLSVVTFKWHTPGYRAKFEAEHVNTLRNMVIRHYPESHRFICITDDPKGLNDGIEVVPMWGDHANIQNPTGGGRPSCYRRMKLFDPAIKDLVGGRFVMLDLDCVITGDMRPLWNRKEDVVLWRSPSREWPYNGAMMMMDAGARPHVWESFDPVKSPAITHAKGYRGSDQAWISHCLGNKEATWSDLDGVYFYGSMPRPRNRIPKDARIIFTTGGCAPWTLQHEWVRKHYR
jgi:hypothetical protein